MFQKSYLNNMQRPAQIHTGPSFYNNNKKRLDNQSYETIKGKSNLLNTQLVLSEKTRH